MSISPADSRRDRILARAWKRSQAWPRRESIASLRKLLVSRRSADRLLALLLMRGQLVEGQPRVYLGMARRVVQDPDNNVRWQALIVVGEFIPYAPESVWRVAARHAESRSADMRMAVTTILLEHLLQHDFDTFFARVVSRIERGSRHLAEMLPGCWGLTEEQERRVRGYLRGEPPGSAL